MKVAEVVSDKSQVRTLRQYLDIEYPEMFTMDMGRYTDRIYPAQHGYMGIRSFGDCPAHLPGSLFLNNQPIRSFEGAPKDIDGHLSFAACTNLKSFHNIHRHISQIKGILTIDPDVSHLLGIVLIEGIVDVQLWPPRADRKPLTEILMRYISSEDRDINQCQEELIDAGFVKQARI